jgi:ribosomal-protein-alanine N-acetyltransferase
LHVLNFSVCPAEKRSKIGTAMVEKLKSKLSRQRRNRVVLEIRETNLDAQLFFRKQGFLALSVLRDFYEDTVEDAYLMQFRCEAEAVEIAPNRISRLAG